MRQTKNLHDEVDASTGEILSFGELTRYQRFRDKVLVPTMCRMLANTRGTSFREPVTMTLRQIQDEFGLAASQVFSLCFKLLKRGGYSEKTGTGYKSVWVVSDTAMDKYAAWSADLTQERTCRSLKNALLEAGVQRLEWSGNQVTGWLEHSVRAAHQEKRREKWRKVRAATLKRTVEELEQVNATYY